MTPWSSTESCHQSCHYNNSQINKYKPRNGFFKSKFGDITVIELAKVADSREAMDNFYKSLRESEEFEGYKYCILPDLSAMLESNVDEFETLVDRVSRAASGRRIKIKV